jgi:hypothetical protein
MTKKSNQVAITIPRSFAALAKAAATDPKGSPWLRSVLIEALPAGRVRGTAVDGFGLMRMEADVEDVVGVLMPIRSPGEVGDEPGEGEGITTTVSCPQTGESVTLDDKQWKKVGKEIGR